MSGTGMARLEELRQRVGSWRKKHGGRGRRLPEWIWMEAAQVASEIGVPVTAGALRLPAMRVERVLNELVAANATAAEPKCEFIELEAGDVALAGQVTVEIRRADGDRVQVHGCDPSSVAQVAGLLLGTVRS